ncbi:MAG: hypothetical protein DRP00_01290 [Candidatus Aenigmatarchaeota archaeon]|nr:MAG: hypothetical protein DRP00_01290 [Candidatus Aenigmarchaeota archaeon]
MKEEIIAIIEGEAKPNSRAAMLISKYPEWIDRGEEEIGDIRKMRGVCPKCQEFHTFKQHRRHRKWRCLRCKKYFSEEEIINTTIRFVHETRKKVETQNTVILFCLFCKKITRFERATDNLFRCSKCGNLMTERAVAALAWDLGWIVGFT